MASACTELTFPLADILLSLLHNQRYGDTLVWSVVFGQTDLSNTIVAVDATSGEIIEVSVAPSAGSLALAGWVKFSDLAQDRTNLSKTKSDETGEYQLIYSDGGGGLRFYGRMQGGSPWCSMSRRRTWTPVCGISSSPGMMPRPAA